MEKTLTMDYDTMFLKKKKDDEIQDGEDLPMQVQSEKQLKDELEKKKKAKAKALAEEENHVERTDE